MILGYVPLGFTFGVAALDAGLGPAPILAMSLFVYAVSSQLLAVQLLAAHAPVLSIVATVGVCNLRHMLMASALAPYVRHYRPRHLLLFALQLCDEAFALHSVHLSEAPVPRRQVLAANLMMHAGMLCGVGLALVSQTSAAAVQRLGLDYAPVAMFIALLVLLIKDRLQLGVALGSGALALLLRSTALGSWSLIIATMIGASVGLGTGRLRPRRWLHG